MEQKRKIVSPVYFFAALVLMATLHFLAPLARFIEAPYSYLGCFLEEIFGDRYLNHKRCVRRWI